MGVPPFKETPKWNLISGWGMRIHPEFFFFPVFSDVFFGPLGFARLSSSNQGYQLFRLVCYCWWFLRNPKANHRLEVSKTFWTMGYYSTTQLVNAGFFWTRQTVYLWKKHTCFWGQNCFTTFSPPQNNPPESRDFKDVDLLVGMVRLKVPSGPATPGWNEG